MLRRILPRASALRRLLEFGGLGHTCSIHFAESRAILEFGSAMPAFRVVGEQRCGS